MSPFAAKPLPVSGGGGAKAGGRSKRLSARYSRRLR